MIGYEALREKLNGLSPVSTGDALGGGWAGTNFALYGTSAIGYLGSLIDETNVEKILKLDVLKTDFFHGAAYPTYLLYNPYSTTQTVQFDAGAAASDIYEALTETFISKNVSGKINLTLPANQALMVTITPAGGTLTYNRHKMLINNVVVDYQQTAKPYTRPVRIKALAAAQKIVQISDSIKVYATAFDPDNGTIAYKWTVNKGTITGTGQTVTFNAPNMVHPDTIGTEGCVTIQLIAMDIEGNSDTASLDLTIVSKINAAPQISTIQKSVAYTATNGTVQLTALATDPNGDPITYTWTATGGTFNGTTKTVAWTAPNTEGVFQITVKATDNGNLSAQATTTILVKNFATTTGNLIAYYPLTGNYVDVSGNQLHGEGNGTVFVPDRKGVPDGACYFNGGTQNVSVANNPKLNFQDAITVSCWFNAARLPEKETFLLSHGSWQNRWKVSFTPDKYMRWTVNTLNAIADLDAPTPFVIDSFYHVTVTYDGALMAIYINGTLMSYKVLTGKIRTATLPFLMAQMLPTDATYNFKGIIDEVKIYDYALIPSVVASLFQQSTTALKNAVSFKNDRLHISPNPVSDILSIQFPLKFNTKLHVQVHDLNGRLMLEKDAYMVHPHTIGTEGGVSNLNIQQLVSGVYILTVKMDNTTTTARFVKL